MSTKEYVKNIIRDKNIASITPTSKKGVQEICGRINQDNRVVIVEYGPATGVFTNYLLERITHDSLIIAIELNENFVQYLNENITDERLIVHHGSAEEVEEITRKYADGKADYVLSGIPFSFLTPELRDKVVKNTSLVLKEKGKFLPYQTFYQKDEHLKKYLEKHFANVHDQYFFRNLPPMRIYEASK